MTCGALGSCSAMNGRPRAAETAAPVTPRLSHDGFQHVALTYNSEPHLVSEVSAFVRAALRRGEPVMVSVPDFHLGPLRAALDTDAGRVSFTDMAEIGGNPARMIPAVSAFAGRHQGRRVSCVGECVWPARRSPEVLEAVKNEALTNLAFAGQEVTALCPYAAELPAGVLALAEQTHPLLAGPTPGQLSPSTGYLGPNGIPAPCLEPLPAPPPTAQALPYQRELSTVRALAREGALKAGLSEERAVDLTIAVSELAANTLRHSPDGGTLRIWQTAGELVCEVSDLGWIADPLAGRRPPDGDGQGGQGLWVVNQVCDLVERRTGPDGTTIRVHMYTGRPPA
jgi:anti-sigma regulatory factor (Ser/Thr protein kinase)